MKNVPEKLTHLLEDESKAFAFLATIMDDGSPQVTPLWFDVEGETIRINTAKGRTKDRNMRERPQVALTIMTMDNPYEYMQIRGRVVEILEEGALEHIDLLSMNYQGKHWVETPDQVRVIFKILPEAITD